MFCNPLIITMKNVSLYLKVFWEESDLKQTKEIFLFNILTTRQWFNMVCSLIINVNRHLSGHSIDVK